MGKAREGADLDIVAHAHGVLAGEARWRDVMTALNRRFELSYSLINTTIGTTGKLNAGVNSTSSTAIEEVLDHWTHFDTRSPRFIRRAKADPGRWVSDGHLYEPDEIDRSALHHDYFRPRGTDDFVGLTRTISGTDYFFLAGVPIGRKIPDAGALDALSATLTPLMQIADLWVAQNRSRALHMLSADGPGRPAILIDTHGRWSWAGRASEAALSRTLSIVDGRPRFAEPALWRGWLAALGKVGDIAPPPPLTLQTQGEAPRILVAHRIKGDRLDPFSTGEMAVVLSLCNAASPSRAADCVLEALGLTPAEARLAARVGRALSPTEAASELGISITTARGSLAAIYAKLGLSRQAQLVRLVTLLLN